MYLLGKASTEDLQDDLQHIGTARRVPVIGDFNAHHPIWGHHTVTPRGTEVANWATYRSLT